MTSPFVLAEFNPNDVKPGWVALLIVLALCVVTYFLWRSMNAQLRKITIPSTRKPPHRIPSAEDKPATQQPVERSAEPPPADR
jgi:hypothetical protein